MPARVTKYEKGAAVWPYHIEDHIEAETLALTHTIKINDLIVLLPVAISYDDRISNT